MSTLASTLPGVLHRPAASTAPRQPAYRRRIPRCVGAPGPLRRHPPRQSTLATGTRRSRCGAHRAVPGPPRTGPRQLCAHPQRPAGGHSCPVPRRRTEPSRAGRRHRPRARDTAQARAAEARDLPVGRRGRRPARRARPYHMDRSPRPHPPRSRGADRFARLGAHRPALCRSVLRPGAPPGTPAASLRPVLGEGSRLSAAGAPRRLELLLQMLATGLPVIPILDQLRLVSFEASMRRTSRGSR